MKRVPGLSLRVAVAALATLHGSVLHAQTAALLTGRITSEFGTPLAGANVVIEQLSISVSAGPDGRYSITVPAERVRGQSVLLRIRAIGYTPQSRPIVVTPGAQQLDFALSRDVNRLEEIVVTGTVAATTQKKLPFSVVKLDESDLSVVATNPLRELQAKVPGALIVQPSGRPGATPAIVLRGPKSLAAGGRQQGPLIILDGAILNGGTQDINGEDVESIEVVKGAAASTLYGSRAGAGVIQITTKSPHRAPLGAHLTVHSEYGFDDVQREYAHARRHFLLMDERNERFCIKVAGQPPCSRTVDFEEEARRVNDIASAEALTPYAFERDYWVGSGPSTLELKGLFQANQWPKAYDPIAQIATNGGFVSNTAGITGRSGGTAYFASISRLSEDGAMRYLRGYRRESARANLEQTVGETWSILVSSTYAGATQFPATSASTDTVDDFFRVTRVPMGVNLLRRDQLGRLYIRSNPLLSGQQNANPLYAHENTHGQVESDRFIASLVARYTPMSWLMFDATGSTDRVRSTDLLYRDREYRATSPFGTLNGGTRGVVVEGSAADQSQNLMLGGQATFGLGADLRGTVTTRYSFEQEDKHSSYNYGEGMAITGLVTLGNATTNLLAGSDRASATAIGVIAGIQLEYKERYIIDGLLRYDGSSLFGAEERWHPYHRNSIAWRLSEEPFWPIPSLVGDLKLRASVGTAGGRPRFDAQYETFSLGTGGAVTATTLGNKRLKPEHTIETEYGFDAELLRKYGVSLTYARDITSGQLLRVPAPAGSGYPNEWQNAGTLDSKTWELSLRIPLVASRSLVWSSQLGWDRSRTFITALNAAPFFGDVGPAQGGTGIRFYYAAGERFGTMYGRKFATRCSELPPPFSAQCGPGLEWQANDEGYIVWVGQGHSWREGVTSNLWQAIRPGCLKNGAPITATGVTDCLSRGGTVNAPWGAPATHWGMPTALRDSTAALAVVPLGNTMPDYRVTMTHTVQWKRLNAYGLLDLSVGNRVFNMERQWLLADFMVREQDQDGKSVETAKPLGYYWRASAPANVGVGGFYDDGLIGNNHTIEDGSYVKLREARVTYDVGLFPLVPGEWSVSLVGRNMYTWTRYSGWDPEAGLPGGRTSSAAITTGGMFQYPPTRTFTVAVSARF